MKHQFKIAINWENGRNGVGQLKGKNIETKVSIPQEMNGPNTGTNPDEMLIGAASTCYIISFAALLENMKMNPIELFVESVGTVDVTGHVFSFEEIIHHVSVRFEQEVMTEKVERMAKKAEETCMISKALKGNVKVRVKLNIL